MKVVAIAGAIVLALSACSSAPRQYSEAMLAKYEQSLLNTLGQASNFKGTDVLLRRKLAADEFAALPPERQYHWLQMSASIALGLNDLDYAHSTSLRMIALEEATTEAWRVRFSCTRRSFDPSRFWSALARAHLEQGQIERATQAAVRVTAPRLILTMRVDQRFQPVLVAQPEHFDVLAAVDQEIAALEQLSKACPRLITPKMMQAQALIVARRYDLAVKVTDEVLAASGVDRIPSASYDDAPSAFPWILNARASALQGLAQWDEAEKYLRAAASFREAGQPNVSQMINLAFMYASLRRPREAAEQLSELAGSTSSFGGMQVQRVRVLAAVAENDERAVLAALDNLRDKQDDSPATFQKALLDANQIDEAAALLIRRLRSSSLRADALFEVQDYPDVLPTPAAQARQQRWAELRAREDVQAAIAEVGHVEVVPLDFE